MQYLVCHALWYIPGERAAGKGAGEQAAVYRRSTPGAEREGVVEGVGALGGANTHKGPVPVLPRGMRCQTPAFLYAVPHLPVECSHRNLSHWHCVL